MIDSEASMGAFSPNVNKYFWKVMINDLGIQNAPALVLFYLANTLVDRLFSFSYSPQKIVYGLKTKIN